MQHHWVKLRIGFIELNISKLSSPHIHMLINAPRFGIDSDEKDNVFVNKVISCQKPSDSSELLKLVNRQIHGHSHTCRKKSKTECRFNYPQPPMGETTILYPIDVEEDDQTQLEQLKHAKKQVNDMKKEEDITFEQLLLNLNVSEEIYLLSH